MHETDKQLSNGVSDRYKPLEKTQSVRQAIAKQGRHVHGGGIEKK